jgi:hypothetical protein
MKNYFNPEQAENYGDSNVSEFAGILGEKLFPRKKKKPKEPGGGSGGGGGITKTKKFVFAMPNISITNSGKIHVTFDLDIKESVSILIKTKVSAGVDSIDYEKWINPAKQNEVRVLFVDRNKERLARIVQDLIENINLIRQSPLKDFFDKRYKITPLLIY